MWQLNQTKQCKTCPWRKESKVENIPNYSSRLHQDLEDTIAYLSPEEQLSDSSPENIMLCHHSNLDSDQTFCIGWVHNQLGVGNNIKLRMYFMGCKNGNQIEVVGEQVKSFEDTFK